MSSFASAATASSKDNGGTRAVISKKALDRSQDSDALFTEGSLERQDLLVEHAGRVKAEIRDKMAGSQVGGVAS